MKQRIRKSLVMLTAVLALGFAVRSAQAQDLKPEQFGKAMDAYLEKDENVEKVGNALRKYFMKKEQEARSAAEKAEKDKIEDQFKNPVKIDLAGSPVKGPKDAKVTIV
ncbi:MAG TPA: hypothetical protein PLP17_12790, partial [Oligoflexia bacterium]|nr:hypothetical protein [Oligoflexia bacterium]